MVKKQQRKISDLREFQFRLKPDDAESLELFNKMIQIDPKINSEDLATQQKANGLLSHGIKFVIKDYIKKEFPNYRKKLQEATENGQT